jgi:anti-anti-sigma factor
MDTLDPEVPRVTARLQLEGDVDLASAPEIEARLRRLEEDLPPVLLVDLRAVTFLDSAERRARKDERRLILVRGRESVDRVFRLTLLDHRLEFVDDPDGSEGL